MTKPKTTSKLKKNSNPSTSFATIIAAASKMDSEIEKLKSKLRVSEENRFQYEKEIEDLNFKIDRKEDEIIRIKEDVDRVRSENRHLQYTLQSKEDTISSLHAELKAFRPNETLRDMALRVVRELPNANNLDRIKALRSTSPEHIGLKDAKDAIEWAIKPLHTRGLFTAGDHVPTPEERAEVAKEEIATKIMSEGGDRITMIKKFRAVTEMDLSQAKLYMEAMPGWDKVPSSIPWNTDASNGDTWTNVKPS